MFLIPLQHRMLSGRICFFKGKNMNISSILAAGFIMNFVMVLFVICSVVLILVILLQKGKGGGLSSAFGGGAAGGVLGAKTGDFLTWVTIVLAAVFLFMAVILAKFYKPTHGNYEPEQTQQLPMPENGDRAVPEQPVLPAENYATQKQSETIDDNSPD